MSIKIGKKEITDVYIENSTSNRILENDDIIFNQTYDITFSWPTSSFDCVRYMIEGSIWKFAQGDGTTVISCPYGKKIYYYGAKLNKNINPMVQTIGPITSSLSINIKSVGNFILNLDRDLDINEEELKENADLIAEYDANQHILKTKNLIYGAKCTITEKVIKFENVILANNPTGSQRSFTFSNFTKSDIQEFGEGESKEEIICGEYVVGTTGLYELYVPNLNLFIKQRYETDLKSWYWGSDQPNLNTGKDDYRIQGNEIEVTNIKFTPFFATIYYNITLNVVNAENNSTEKIFPGSKTYPQEWDTEVYNKQGLWKYGDVYPEKNTIYNTSAKWLLSGIGKTANNGEIHTAGGVKKFTVKYPDYNNENAYINCEYELTSPLSSSTITFPLFHIDDTKHYQIEAKLVNENWNSNTWSQEDYATIDTSASLEFDFNNTNSTLYFNPYTSIKVQYNYAYWYNGDITNNTNGILIANAIASTPTEKTITIEKTQDGVNINTINGNLKIQLVLNENYSIPYFFSVKNTSNTIEAGKTYNIGFEGNVNNFGIEWKKYRINPRYNWSNYFPEGSSCAKYNGQYDKELENAFKPFVSTDEYPANKLITITSGSREGNYWVSISGNNAHEISSNVNKLEYTGSSTTNTKIGTYVQNNYSSSQLFTIPIKTTAARTWTSIQIENHNIDSKFSISVENAESIFLEVQSTNYSSISGKKFFTNINDQLILPFNHYIKLIDKNSQIWTFEHINKSIMAKDAVLKTTVRMYCT